MQNIIERIISRNNLILVQKSSRFPNFSQDLVFFLKRIIANFSNSVFPLGFSTDEKNKASILHNRLPVF